ncbi:hypothetical protein K6Y31_06305 [Motilimonas cestriensis]|uniref:Holin of 3TMs, for gene-transfer release n=1 Tax=Motilimonas cestriensis TaxID=2742685 RepID=A0ABS8W7S3_9GAMM|nr:hypothetical protein [Motilimonas cestriensis]MCE2594422.1 hypothetical protein [Motilimonas cestriensis]
MDPVSIIGLASTLLKVGPSVVKAVGSLFGGDTEDTAIKVANTVDHIRGSLSSKEAQQVAMEQALNQMPPAQFVQLQQMQVELAKIDQERESRQFQHDETLNQQQQATIQNGDNAQGEYVRQTRPLIARICTYAALLYTIGFEALKAQDVGTGASWELLGCLLSMPMAYMGVRTWDAFSRFKGPKL